MKNKLKSYVDGLLFVRLISESGSAKKGKVKALYNLVATLKGQQ